MPRPLAPTDVWVAFSYAGEQRDLVQRIAEALEARLGKGRVYYDRWYEAWINGGFSRQRLMNIYRNDAAVNVVCLSADHHRKPWTKEERETIVSRRMAFEGARPDAEYHEEFLLRVGDGDVDGFPVTTIFTDARGRLEADIVGLIVDKLCLARPALQALLLQQPVDADSGHTQAAVDALVSAFAEPAPAMLTPAAIAALTARIGLRGDPNPAGDSRHVLSQTLLALLDRPLPLMLDFVAAIERRSHPSPLSTALGVWLDERAGQHPVAVDASRTKAIVLAAESERALAAAKPKAERAQVIVTPDDQATPTSYAVHLAFQTGDDWVIAGDVNRRVADAAQAAELAGMLYLERRNEVEYPLGSRFELVLPQELALGFAHDAHVVQQKRRVKLSDRFEPVLRSFEWRYNRQGEFPDAPAEACANWKLGNHGIAQHRPGCSFDLRARVSETDLKGKQVITAHGALSTDHAQALWFELVFHCVPIALLVEHPQVSADDVHQAAHQMAPSAWPRWARDLLSSPGAAFAGRASAVALLYDDPDVRVPPLGGKKFQPPAQRSTP